MAQVRPAMVVARRSALRARIWRMCRPSGSKLDREAGVAGPDPIHPASAWRQEATLEDSSIIQIRARSAYRQTRHPLDQASGRQSTNLIITIFLGVHSPTPRGTHRISALIALTLSVLGLMWRTPRPESAWHWHALQLGWVSATFCTSSPQHRPGIDKILADPGSPDWSDVGRSWPLENPIGRGAVCMGFTQENMLCSNEGNGCPG